jgi:Uma2 family endonuclease
MTQTHATRLTVDEFERLLALPGYQDRRIELINGEMVEAMPGFAHARIATKLIVLLHAYLTQRPIGQVFVELRLSLPGLPLESRVPDVCVIIGRDAELAQLEDGDALPFVPDLCIEIASPGQPMALLSQKAAFYLAHGGRMVWLIYPDRGIVEWLTRDGRDLLTGQMPIDGGDVLPGLTLTAGEVVA